MACRTIAVCFTDKSSAEALARAGTMLARQHNAHLLGLYVLPDPFYHPMTASYITGEVVRQIRQGQRRSAEEIEAILSDAATREGVTPEWRALHPGSFTIGERLCESARAADLVLTARPDENSGPHAQEDLIRNCGRPVLMIPPGYEPTPLGASAVIGWSPTREATRAAHDARLLLDEGAEVVLLSVERDPDEAQQDPPIHQMASTLSRHGMNATVKHRAPQSHGIADTLEREAFETGAGFIATGAFGHSLAYDFVIGTVTRDLMREAKRPVLFSK